MHSKAFLSLIISTMALSLLATGCCNDDDSVIPDPESMGSIIVNPIPDSLNAPWTLSGPSDYSKNSKGDETLSEMPLGEYFLTWGYVEDWV